MVASASFGILVRTAQSFEWSPSVTFLSDFRVVASVVASYLVGIWLITNLPNAVKSRVSASFIFKALVSIHSLILCLGSLGMFAGGLVAYRNEYLSVEKSFGWLVCKEFTEVSAGPVYFVAYIYYLSKYVELLDTCILALKGKTMSFLHVFHHAVMPIMCWLWLQQRQSLHEIALLTNTSIHVIMYYYYFLSSIGKPPKWKKLVTQSQILQFVFSFAMGCVYLVARVSRGSPCSGEFSLRMNVAINAVFLTLFLDFHRKSYKRKMKKKT